MASKPMKVLFLSTMNAGTAYYRMWALKQAMNRQKLADVAMPWYWYNNTEIQAWQFHVKDDPRVYARSGVINGLVKQADIIVVQYLHSWESLALIEALKACYPQKVFLTEIDDNVLDTPPWNDAFEQYQPGWKYRNIIVEQIKALDGVIVSTPFLRDLYKEFNKHCYVVPNGLDFQVWDKSPAESTKQIRIGWVGGASHTEDLRTIEKPIKEFLSRTKNVWFYCVHGAPDFFKDQSKICTPRDFKPINRYPKWVSRFAFDIGIAPLVDCNFNRAKSNLRKLEYGGLRVPVVAANVGEFARTVKHGKDGFLYNNSEEFIQCLDLLVRNEKLRKAMGRFNYLDVKANYNVDKIAEDYVDILKDCIKRGQTTKVDVSSMPHKMENNTWIAEPPVASLP